MSLDEGRRLLAVSEDELLAGVIQLAELRGWAWYHTHDSRHSEAGWPDLALARAPRLVIAELKSQRGRVTLAQTAWLDLLGKCGVETYLWRPSNWPGDIDAVLT